METVNENSSAVLTVIFKDENKKHVIPDSISYRIDDIKSNTSIKASTFLIPSETSIGIDITAIENRILTPTNKFEQRAVTTIFTYNSGTKQGTSEFKYQVENLSFIP